MVLVYFALAIFSNQFFSLGSELREWSRSTGNLIDGTLLNSLPFLIVLGLLWWKVGRLRGRDLGLESSKLPGAIIFVVGIWVAAQLWVLLLRQGEVTIDPAWIGGGEGGSIDATTKIGALLGQLFGNSLLEELFCRAFLMVQLMLIFRQDRGWSVSGAWWAAAIFSSLIFALAHLPIDLRLERPLLMMLLVRFISALVLAAIYRLSGNLFIVVGLHSLIDVPLSIFSGSGSSADPAFFAFVPLIVLFLLYRRRR